MDGAPLLLAAVATALGLWLALSLRRLRSERALRRDGETVFKALADACGGLAFVCDENGRMEYVNAALAERIGPDLRHQPCHKALFDRDETCPWCVNVGLFADQTARYEFQDPRDGAWYAALNAPVRRPGASGSKLVVLTDITRDKTAAGQLEDLQERHRIVAEYTHAMEAWLGPEGSFRFVSPACEGLTGYPPEDFMADPDLLRSLAHPEDAPLLADFLTGGEAETLDFRILRRDGAMRWLCAARREVSDGNGGGRGLRLSARDITDRKLMEIQMRYQALHDPMTGLANRVLASDRIAQAVERAKRRERYHFAVAFADVDRLKVINDSFGHRVGDMVLEEIATRLHKGVRQLDMVARYGSDQFVLLLEELDKPRKAVSIIKRCREALAEPVVVDGHELNMSVCFGAVLFPPPEDDSGELVRKANIALHLAKQAGFGKLKVFVPRMLDQAVELMTIERDLRRAVANNEFYMEYQPILSLTDSRLKGFEALVRWRHPVRGIVPPTEFIPVAEEVGLITDLGRFVLEESCRTMSGWRENLPQARDLVLSVNLSARQFSQPDLVDCIRDILARTGMPPERLKLEITETAIMENAKAAVEKLNRLKELGIQISIDDFGTGYSSMSYLQKFPLDHLKIDLSFIRNMDSTMENRAIVKAIINLAHSLGLKVIAEGVEKTLQQEILTALECEYGQGYLFSRPVGQDRARAYISGEAPLRADAREELILRDTRAPFPA
ncbi:putative bifunctional diguanylate cyclase/phosphodiesterase [Desulfocurvus sp. DL9XJH121]